MADVLTIPEALDEKSAVRLLRERGLAITAADIWRAKDAGEIAYYAVGKRPHFKRADLLDWAERAQPRLVTIYFIQGETTKLIKIGLTAGRAEGRLFTLQTGSPDKLVLLKAVPAPAAMERMLHERFAAARRHGEWFEPTAELLAYIAELRP